LDNCSTDNTKDICLSYCKVDDRIKYIRNPINFGALGNFNRAIDYANGEYFMYAAHDDFRESTYLTELLKLLISDNEVGLAYSQHAFVDEDSKILRPSHKLPILRNTYSKFRDFLAYLLRYHCDYIVYGLYRTSFLKKALPFEPVIRGKLYYSTALFLLRFLTLAKANSTRKILFYYRIKSRESTLSGSNKLERMVSDAKLQLYLLLRIYNIIRNSSFSSVQKIFLCPCSTLIVIYYIGRRLIGSFFHIRKWVRQVLNYVTCGNKR
jgi:glycosyltransferase involved in cell wall biosynthesis